jgi:amino acid transporter
MFTSLGSIIGSGWLLGALKASQLAGGSSLLSWILAGAIIVLLALVHAELGSTYPLAGGTGRYPKIAFGSFAGFTAGWTSWLQAVTLAPVEVEAVMNYLSNVVPVTLINSSTGALTGWGLVISIVLIAIFTIINILGVRWLAETNNITMIWKIAIPVITIFVLIALTFHSSNFSAGGGFAPLGAHGVFAALPAGVVFALQGFEQAAQLGAEAKNPQRTLPRAIIGAVLIGTVMYLGLEVAFIGALNPMNLLHGWSSPIGKGKAGPYAELALGAGAVWLAVILYVDAFISPAGTGLVYTTTSSRLSYALSAEKFLPRGLSKISARGVPVWSVVFSFIIGVICFLPFPSWNQLVEFISSATFIMYGFAPIALAALRKTDPERQRPYRLPVAGFLAPLSFVCANEIIYWSGWTTNWKVMIAIVVGYILFILSMIFNRGDQRPPLDLRSLVWIAPWFIGNLVISYLGQYDGIKVLPSWVDLLVVAVFSVAIFYLAVYNSLPRARVATALDTELSEGEPFVQLPQHGATA